MRRRHFLEKSFLAVVATAALGLLKGTAASLQSKKLFVNGKRIEDRITELARFGRDANGHGYRVAYTQGDIEGRAWFADLMRKAKLEAVIDEAGNITGKRKGKDSSLKPICFGSHIDMVPDGGNYDGTLGSISALEAIEILNENNVVTNHPLEVIVFANEEGGTIGSKAMAGELKEEGLKQVSQSGLSIYDGIKTIGGNPANVKNCMRKKGDIHAWIELHIEQGGVLEAEAIEIGVVEGIVGIVHWDVTVEGFSNHAGTTPMDKRQDALLAASRLVIAVNEVVTSQPGRQVGTIGKLAVQPGAYNVIPGKVILGLEIRDLSAEKIESLFVEIEKRATLIAAESKTTITFSRRSNSVTPAITDKNLQAIIDSTAKSLGFKTKHMPSGAGHDSQELSVIAPVAMIFVPSVGGISHSPKEFTKSVDMTNGANVLLQTILAIDRQRT
jgi:beta-ureidopropionase / N-carbamoyl-L-amino-acid hydrolase